MKLYISDEDNRLNDEIKALMQQALSLQVMIWKWALKQK